MIDKNTDVDWDNEDIEDDMYLSRLGIEDKPKKSPKSTNHRPATRSWVDAMIGLPSTVDHLIERAIDQWYDMSDPPRYQPSEETIARYVYDYPVDVHCPPITPDNILRRFSDDADRMQIEMIRLVSEHGRSGDRGTHTNVLHEYLRHKRHTGAITDFEIGCDHMYDGFVIRIARRDLRFQFIIPRHLFY